MCTVHVEQVGCVKIYTVNERNCWGQNDSPYSNEDRLAQCDEESVRRCQMICSIPFTRLKI